MLLMQNDPVLKWWKMKSERVRGGPGSYSEHDWKLLLSRIQVFFCLPCEQTVMGAKVEARMCCVTIRVRVVWTKVVRSRCCTYSEDKVWSKVPGISYQSQRRTLNTSSHCILILESPRKTQHSQALDGITLYLHREETEKDQIQWCVSVPHGYQVPTSSRHRATGLHISLVPQWKDPNLSPMLSEILKVGVMPEGC